MIPKLLLPPQHITPKQVIPSTSLKLAMPYFNHAISSTPLYPSIRHTAGFDYSINIPTNQLFTNVDNQSNKFFKKFHNLDDIPHNTAHFLINSMQVMEKFPSIRAIKENAIINMLDALPKNKHKNILAAGCGHGVDAKIIAKYLDNGEVIAIDSSKRMIKEAVKLSDHSKIIYKHINLNDMAACRANTKYFDACHADRLLVSSPDYKMLFQNLISLVKPNGIVSITDVDALSIIFYPYNSVTKVILKQLQSDFVNPFMGRELPELFIDNELVDIEVTPSVSMVRNFADMCQIFQFEEIIASATKNGKLTSNEGEQWFNDMKQADKSRKFMYSVQFFTVQGRIPYVRVS